VLVYYLQRSLKEVELFVEEVNTKRDITYIAMPKKNSTSQELTKSLRKSSSKFKSDKQDTIGNEGPFSTIAI